MPNDIRSVWQSQTKKPSNISLELIRRKARRLEETTHQRVVSTYVAALIIVVIASYIFWQLDEMFFRMGACALILVALSLIHRARKAGSPVRLPLNATLSVSLDFYRQELESQISYLRAGRNTIWPVLLSAALFLTPFVRGAMGKPGMRGFDSRESMYLLLGLVPLLPVMMILLVSVFVAEGRKMRAVQKEIDELDKFTGATRP
ncbi:MAG TPA: hypothetical protein VGQ49_10310 [Bryobacteraceae bacterium]|nr:hypothetical protein [Bryobacteraceae bacterium]